MQNLLYIIRLKHTLLVFLILGLSTATLAQPAGLQGKRFIIGLEASSTVSIGWTDYHYVTAYTSEGYPVTKTDIYSSLQFIIKPTLYLEYILNRKASLQVYGRYFNRKVDLSSYKGYDPNITTSLVTYYPTDRAKASYISGGLRYKWFKHEGLNPIGVYRTIAVEYNLMTYQFSDQNFSTFDYVDNKPAYANPEQTSTSAFSLMYGMGVQRAIGNSVLMNIGVEIGVVFDRLQSESKYTSDSKNYAVINGGRQMWKNNIFNVVFGFALAP